MRALNRLAVFEWLKRDSQGFTLLELIVALTLMGMVLGLVFGGFHLISRNLARGRAQLERTNEMRAVTSFLRQSLRGQRDVEERGGGGRKRAFSGSPHRLRFVAPLFLQQAMSGLYEIRFRWTGDRLLMDWRPFRPNLENRPPFQHRLVSAQITACSFRYYGRRESGRQAAWHPSWDRPQRIPQAVRIALSGEKMPWPPLIVRLSTAE